MKDSELAGAAMEECVLEKDDLERGDVDFDPFDQLNDEANFGAMKKIFREDGLPGYDAPDTSGDIPPLNTETLVCMGDYSKFVIRDSLGQVLLEFEPERVQQMPNGTWVASLNLDERRKVPSHVYPEVYVGRMGTYDGPYKVEPIRPPCRHYLRQLGPLTENPKHKYMYRLCSVRRTTEGAMMGLADMPVWACEMREPIDLPTWKKLQEWDENKIQQGKYREYFPIKTPSAEEK